jgi:hypothetical protein
MVSGISLPLFYLFLSSFSLSLSLSLSLYFLFSLLLSFFPSFFLSFLFLSLFLSFFLSFFISPSFPGTIWHSDEMKTGSASNSCNMEIKFDIAFVLELVVVVVVFTHVRPLPLEGKGRRLVIKDRGLRRREIGVLPQLPLLEALVPELVEAPHGGYTCFCSCVRHPTLAPPSFTHSLTHCMVERRTNTSRLRS